jgi:hypothetical protein
MITTTLLAVPETTASEPAGEPLAATVCVCPEGTRRLVYATQEAKFPRSPRSMKRAPCYVTEGALGARP